MEWGYQRVSICRNGADVTCAILKQKPYNFTTRPSTYITNMIWNHRNWQELWNMLGKLTASLSTIVFMLAWSWMKQVLLLMLTTICTMLLNVHNNMVYSGWRIIFVFLCKHLVCVCVYVWCSWWHWWTVQGKALFHLPTQTWQSATDYKCDRCTAKQGEFESNMMSWMMSLQFIFISTECFVQATPRCK